MKKLDSDAKVEFQKIKQKSSDKNLSLNISQNDIVVKSWEELCSRLYDHSWKSRMQRFRTDFAYRGVSEKEYLLENGLLLEAAQF